MGSHLSHTFGAGAKPPRTQREPETRDQKPGAETDTTVLAVSALSLAVLCGLAALRETVSLLSPSLSVLWEFLLLLLP